MNTSDLDFGATIRALAQGQRVFSRFSLERLLGRGGMGVVWLAHDDKLEREVALKFLPEAVALDPRSVDDLKHETRRSLDLTHPNIVRIYDFFEDSTAAAISMEFVEGGSLARLAVDQPLKCFEPPQIIQWLRQLIDALDYAHNKAKIVHRDLKPANLMVSQDSDLKITDFGISATVTDSMTRVSRLMSSGATPAYSSPQQVMGERPSPADDIYSLGATIFDLLAGKPPFHSGNLLLQVQSKVPDTITKRREELGIKGGKIPEAWERVVAACLAKEPADRPASARAVLEGLESGAVLLQRDAPKENRSERTTVVVPVVPSGPEEDRKPTKPTRPGRTDEAGPKQEPSVDRDAKIGKASGFALAVAMLKGVRSAGGFARWFMGLLVGRAGLLPSLAAIMLPLLAVALVIWLLWPGPREPTVDSPPTNAGAGGQPGDVVTHAPPSSGDPDGKGIGYQPDTTSRLSTGPDSRGVVGPGTGGVSPGRTAASETRTVTGPASDRTGPGETGQTQGPAAPPGGRETRPTTPPIVIAPPPMPASGEIVITSDPSGATVLAEGRVVGRTPLTLPSYPTGRVEFGLRLSGYEEATVAGQVTENQTTRLAKELRRITSVAQAEHAVVVPELDMRLLWLQPGTFLMGSPESESGPDSDEQPQTRVTFSKGFWIGETEVTQGQWTALMGRNPSRNKSAGSRAPVENVSWGEASRFCRMLNQREQAANRVPAGYVFRLPTEAEWEYACRAGTAGPYHGDINQIAVTGRKFSSTRPVASMQPNAWGLYDMHGNVAEWTDGWYGHYPGGSVIDFGGPPDGRVHVFRGGSFDSSPRSTRAAYRGWVSGSTADDSRGFRVVLAPERK